MKLMRQTASAKTRMSEDILKYLELGNQNVRYLLNCYPVVADRAQAMRAIDLRTQEHLIPSRLFGQSPHLKQLHLFFASVYLLTVEHGDPLLD